MLPSKRLWQGAVSHITRSDFYDVLLHACPQIGAAHRFKPTKLCISVSGGPDSMALAYLCHQLTVTHPRVPLKIEAFVIDHGARPESVEEAWKVKGLLWKLNINSRILKLPWPRGIVPIEDPTFESRGRLLRNRTVGRACAETRIENLLTGHHEDDQAETILMRLVIGARGINLRSPMPTNRDMPNCERIFGADRSGRRVTLKMLKDELSRETSTSPATDPVSGLESPDFITFSDGGVKVCRPLLRFTKAQVLATCDFYQIPFVTDRTNLDRTFTLRNTIRYLFKDRKLPRALQPSSLLMLARRQNSRRDELFNMSKKILESTALLTLNTSSAYLEIRVPSIQSVLPTASPTERRYACAFYLQSVLSLVQPWSKGGAVPLDDIKSAVPLIFPELGLPSDGLSQSKLRFTTAGRMFEKLAFPGLHLLEDYGHGNLLARHDISTIHKPSTWRISGAPLMESRRIEFEHRIPHIHPQQKATIFFWCGSFWIRLHNKSSTTLPNLVVRPLQEQDLVKFRARPDRASKSRLNHLLPPSHIRFTLPVIVKRNEMASGGSEDEPLCLPTLDFPGRSQDVGFICEVRYKKIEVEVLKLLLKSPNEGSEVEKSPEETGRKAFGGDTAAAMEVDTSRDEIGASSGEYA